MLLTDRISVCIPALNEGLPLRATIEDLRRNLTDCTDVEYIVADDGSTDGSCDNLGDGVKVIRNDVRLGVSKSARKAVEASTGNVLVICDAHQNVISGKVSDLVREAVQRKAVIVPATGSIQYDENGCASLKSDLYAAPQSSEILQRHLYRALRSKEQNTVFRVQGVSCFYVMLREVYESVGGFMNFTGLFGYREAGFACRCFGADVPVWFYGHVHVGHMFKKAFNYKSPTRGDRKRNQWHMYRSLLSDEAFHRYAVPYLQEDPDAWRGEKVLMHKDCIRDTELFLTRYRKKTDTEMLEFLGLLHEEEEFTTGAGIQTPVNQNTSSGWPQRPEEIADDDVQEYLAGKISIKQLGEKRGPAAPWYINNGKVSIIPKDTYRLYRHSRDNAEVPLQEPIPVTLISDCPGYYRLMYRLYSAADSENRYSECEGPVVYAYPEDFPVEQAADTGICRLALADLPDEGNKE